MSEVGVTQSDRQAAVHASLGYTEIDRDRILRGKIDADDLVQAFFEYRISVREAVIKDVFDKLNGMNGGWASDDHGEPEKSNEDVIREMGRIRREKDLEKYEALRKAFRMMGMDPDKIAENIMTPGNDGGKHIMYDCVGIDEKTLITHVGRSNLEGWRSMWAQFRTDGWKPFHPSVDGRGGVDLCFH